MNRPVRSQPLADSTRQMPPQTRAGRSFEWRRSAFTIIELLVVIGIFSLILAVLLPALASARAEGTKLKCLANLRSIGQALAMYSGDDTRNMTSPVHPMAEIRWLYDGEYEYGGNAGVGVMRHVDFLPENRLLNRYLFSSGASADYNLYRCPTDRGVPKLEEPRWFNFEPFFIDPRYAHLSVYQAAGTSYRLNNHIDFTRRLPTYYQQHFFGPYLRSLTRVPDPTLTVILAETVAEVAKWNAGLHVDGWHRKANNFNALFLDGRAEIIHVTGHHEFRTGENGYWLRRGPGWTMDCYPAPPILDLPNRGG